MILLVQDEGESGCSLNY